MTLKILHLATHSGVYRGGAVQACRMAEGLAARGHEVTLLSAIDATADEATRRADLETWSYLEDKGVRVESMDYRGISGLFRLRRTLEAQDFDVVHAHRDDALIAARWALVGRRRPALVAQRGTISRPPSVAARAFRSRKVRRVVAVAGAVRESLVEHARVPRGKVDVVYGSVDLEEFKPREPDPELKASLGIPAGAFVVGSLSAYRGSKGFRNLVPALKAVMRDDPGIVGVFLGHGVPENTRALIERHDLVDRVHLLGHRDDVNPWLSIMDVTVVAATKREGLSGVLRESLAAGVPVISTDCAGNGEIVQDRRTGLLVPMRDTNRLAEALRWARTHPLEMKQMAEQGRAWVVEHCSLQAQCEVLESIYNSVR